MKKILLKLYLIHYTFKYKSICSILIRFFIYKIIALVNFVQYKRMEKNLVTLQKTDELKSSPLTSFGLILLMLSGLPVTSSPQEPDGSESVNISTSSASARGDVYGQI